jgi:hypothetical protein
MYPGRARTCRAGRLHDRRTPRRLRKRRTPAAATPSTARSPRTTMMAGRSASDSAPRTPASPPLKRRSPSTICSRRSPSVTPYYLRLRFCEELTHAEIGGASAAHKCTFRGCSAPRRAGPGRAGSQAASPVAPPPERRGNSCSREDWRASASSLRSSRDAALTATPQRELTRTTPMSCPPYAAARGQSLHDVQSKAARFVGRTRGKGWPATRPSALRVLLRGSAPLPAQSPGGRKPQLGSSHRAGRTAAAACRRNGGARTAMRSP